MFTLQGVIGKGGFANIHLAKRDDGLQMVIKLEDTPSIWDAHMTRLAGKRFNRTNPRLATRILPTVHSCVKFVDKTMTLLDYYPHGNLLDWINSCRRDGISIHKELCALEVMKIINSLHQIGILHGDIKPDNFMVVNTTRDSRNNRIAVVKMIDFGRSIDMSAYPENTAFMRSCNTSGFECIQMQNNLPWNLHVDLFGIAATAHQLQFPQFMKPVFDEGAKKYKVPHRRLPEHWEIFYDELLNFPTPTRHHVPTIKNSPLPKLIEMFESRFGLSAIQR